MRVLRSFLRVTDLTRRDLDLTLERALAWKRDPRRNPQLLAGRSVTLYFNKPSTRTRISFETAVHRLGGLPITVGPNDLQMGRGETIEDSARVISRFSTAFVTRTYLDEEVVRFSKAASIPVINALTDGHHPCQALADALTIRERFGTLKGKVIAYVGAGNNVTHSLVEVCALSGAEVRVVCPPSYRPDAEVMARAERIADAHGGRVGWEPDPTRGVAGVDVVYTDTWLSMGDPYEERVERAKALTPYQVNRELMSRAKETAIFLHCLPAHREEEVTNEVADSAQSMIFDQAENKLHTSIAILELLLTRELEGGETAES